MLRSFLLFAALLALSSFKPATAYPYNWPTCDPEWCKAAEKKDESVILEAIQNGEKKICDCLCEPPVGEWKRLLHKTACSEAVAFADLMISEPFECGVDIYDHDGNRPLHEAAGCCNTPMAYVRCAQVDFLS